MEKRRVLIIDGDSNFCEQTKKALAPYQFEVIWADPEGTDPLSAINDYSPVLIFMSVELPGKAGFGLCRKAKKGPAKEIPLVLTTGSLDSDTFLSHKKLRVSADEYLEKRGLTDATVLSTVDSFVGLGEAEFVEHEPVIMEEQFEAAEVEAEVESANEFGGGTDQRIEDAFDALTLDEPEEASSTPVLAALVETQEPAGDFHDVTIQTSDVISMNSLEGDGYADMPDRLNVEASEANFEGFEETDVEQASTAPAAEEVNDFDVEDESQSEARLFNANRQSTELIEAEQQELLAAEDAPYEFIDELEPDVLSESEAVVDEVAIESLANDSGEKFGEDEEFVELAGSVDIEEEFEELDMVSVDGDEEISMEALDDLADLDSSANIELEDFTDDYEEPAAAPETYAEFENASEVDSQDEPDHSQSPQIQEFHSAQTSADLAISQTEAAQLRDQIASLEDKLAVAASQMDEQTTAYEEQLSEVSQKASSLEQQVQEMEASRSNLEKNASSTADNLENAQRKWKKLADQELENEQKKFNEAEIEWKTKLAQMASANVEELAAKVEAFDEKFGKATVAHQEELQALASSHENAVEQRVQELTAAHTEALTALREEQARALEASASQAAATHEEQLASLQADLTAKHSQELSEQRAALESAKDDALTSLRKDLEAQHAVTISQVTAEMEESNQAATLQLRSELEANFAEQINEKENVHAEVLKSLASDFETAQTQLAQTQSQSQGLHLLVEAAKTTESELRTQLEEARASITDWKSRTSEAELTTASTQAELNVVIEQATEQDKALSDLREQIAAQTSALEQANEQSNRFESQANERAQEIQSIQSSLETVEKQLADSEQNLENANIINVGLGAEKSSLEEQVRNFEEDFSAIEDDLGRTRAALSSAREKLETDEATSNRAKQALAVALTLLDSNSSAVLENQDVSIQRKTRETLSSQQDVDDAPKA